MILRPSFLMNQRVADFCDEMEEPLAGMYLVRLWLHVEMRDCREPWVKNCPRHVKRITGADNGQVMLDAMVRHGFLAPMPDSDRLEVVGWKKNQAKLIHLREASAKGVESRLRKRAERNRTVDRTEDHTDDHTVDHGDAPYGSPNGEPYVSRLVVSSLEEGEEEVQEEGGGDLTAAVRAIQASAPECARMSEASIVSALRMDADADLERVVEDWRCDAMDGACDGLTPGALRKRLVRFVTTQGDRNRERAERDGAVKEMVDASWEEANRRRRRCHGYDPRRDD